MPLTGWVYPPGPIAPNLLHVDSCAQQPIIQSTYVAPVARGTHLWSHFSHSRDVLVKVYLMSEVRGSHSESKIVRVHALLALMLVVVSVYRIE